MGTGYEPWALQVLEVENGRIVELTFFLDVETCSPDSGSPSSTPEPDPTGSGRGRRGRRARRLLLVHPEDLPGVAVGVLEAAAVHEPRSSGSFACKPPSERRVGEGVDTLAAGRGEREDRLGLLRVGSTSSFVVNSPNLALRQQHHVGALADDHRGGRLVGEALVEREAERGEERDRAVEILDGEVDEQLAEGIDSSSARGSTG